MFWLFTFRLLITRASILVLGLVPVWFALQKYSDVQSIVVLETKFIASTFFIPVVLGLNSRRGTPSAAIASMAGGGLACLLWNLTGNRIFPALDATEIGIAASALLYLSVSRFTRPASPQNLEAFLP